MSEHTHCENGECAPAFLGNAQLDAAVTKALEDIESRSFAGRHPELGKMFKDPVCGKRHRGSPCEQKFAEAYTEEDLDTGEVETFYRIAKPINGFVGKSAFKGKRKSPHANARNLMLVELTQELYPNYEEVPMLFPDGTVRVPEPREAMFAARREAALILRRGIRAVRNRKNAQSYLSRKINAGLANPGSRI